MIYLIIAIYARYSCDKQRDTSIEDQIRRCRETALRLGLIVQDVLIFTDSALSGREEALEKREGYRAFSQAWADGRFDVFLVDEFGRLSRDGVEQAKIMRRLEKNRRVRMITSDGIDTNEPDWQLRLGLQGVLAQQEIRKIQHRVGRGMLGQLERGYMIATPAFGYDLKREFDGLGNRIGSRWVVNDTEAAIVREVYERRVAGQSMHQIAAWLNTSGVPCSRAAKSADGGYWRPARIRNLLKNPIYRGEFVWHGSINHRKKSEALGVPVDEKAYARPELRLVSDETWFRCNTKSISRSGYGGGKHALAGLIKCGCCNGTLVLSSQERCRSVYCAGCTVAKSTNGEGHRQSITVAAAGVQILLTRCLHYFLTPTFLEAFRTSLRQRLTGDRRQEVDACAADLAKQQRVQERFSQMLAGIDDDDPVLAERYEEARQKVNATKLRLEALKAGYVQINAQAVEAQLRVNPADLVEELFDADVPPERLRAILSRLFPTIVLEGKQGRYASTFLVHFAPGAALSIASATETVDASEVTLRFQLRYSPDSRSARGPRWSVSLIGDL